MTLVVEALRSAERPVIVAGNGVRVGGACEQLAGVAQLLDVPVVTTAHGKGVVDEQAPYSAGVIGAFGWPSANDLLGDADTLFAVGTKLGTTDTIDEHAALIDPRRQMVIQVDVDPLMLAWTTPVSRPILADAKSFLERVLKQGTSTERPSALGAAERARAAHSADSDHAFTSDEVPFTPQRVIDLLNRWVPENGIVTADAGENRLFMMRWYRSKRPGGYLQPAAGGGMGHAVPAALGAKLFDRDASVIAVCGDGGFAMSISWPHDSGRAGPSGGRCCAQQPGPWLGAARNGGAGYRRRIRRFDHAAIARAIGCDGVRPENVEELQDALSGLSSLQRPLVIDVPTGLATSFRDILDPIDERRKRSGGY